MNECTIIFGDGCCVVLHGDDYDINFDEMETSELIAFILKKHYKKSGARPPLAQTWKKILKNRGVM